ncbi:MAG: hypothetical protein DI570_22320 [Phenylobacterium zucineum]|nr:MAG: hypothetical protein DI570_22320 [Phenylobacterium zucineum]
MISLAYFSSATPGHGQPDLVPILAASRRNNSAAGVTGLLCHIDGSFLQFLEGDDDAVRATFERISHDPRHRDLVKVHDAPIAGRAFGEWSMGLVNPKEVDTAHQVFCRSLRHVEISASSEHRATLEGLLSVFRAWLR